MLLYILLANTVAQFLNIFIIELPQSYLFHIFHQQSNIEFFHDSYSKATLLSKNYHWLYWNFWLLKASICNYFYNISWHTFLRELPNKFLFTGFPLHCSTSLQRKVIKSFYYIFSLFCLVSLKHIYHLIFSIYLLDPLVCNFCFHQNDHQSNHCHYAQVSIWWN